MKILFALLGIITIAVPAYSDTDFSSSAPQSGELYNQAEKLEWYSENTTKQVDDLYERAAAAGSDLAKMMRAYTRLVEIESSSAAKKLAEELCPEMEEIAKKWGESEDDEQNFHLARYYILPLCKNKNLKKAQALLLKSAETGNAKSQYYMGRMLLKKHADQAAEWFKKSADQGFPQSIANLGACYLQGTGVKEDKKKGLELIAKALDSGNPNTRYDIAIWYLEGSNGLERDIAKSAQILEELVKKDFKPAQIPLEDIKKIQAQ